MILHSIPTAFHKIDCPQEVHEQATANVVLFGPTTWQHQVYISLQQSQDVKAVNYILHQDAFALGQFIKDKQTPTNPV